jgi:ABC-type glycerol-3-phosphate transport system substrate-binding protein
VGMVRHLVLLLTAALLIAGCGLTGLPVGGLLLYIANSDPATSTITVYNETAGGNTAPIRTIGGANTTLNTPRDVEVDAVGNTYVVNLATNAVTVFAAGANGNVAPIRTIAGPSPGPTPA